MIKVYYYYYDVHRSNENNDLNEYLKLLQKEGNKILDIKVIEKYEYYLIICKEEF